jgi:hypothetical protein
MIVLIMAQDGLSGIAPGGQMIKRAGQLDAQGADHGNDRSGSNSKIKDLTPLLLFLRMGRSLLDG